MAQWGLNVTCRGGMGFYFLISALSESICFASVTLEFWWAWDACGPPQGLAG